MSRSLAAAILLTFLWAPSPLDAQTLGTFRWQLQPFCNVITVTVVQQGGQYQLDGTDDLCGAAAIASVVGRAFPNPDGTIGFGLSTVTTTGAAAIHIDARISIATLGGTWTDSAGNSGSFVFTTGAGSGGSLRPVPPGGIAPGSITGAQLAPGLIASTTAGFGTCPAGQYVRGVLASGALICEPFSTPPVLTAIAAANNTGQESSIAIGSDGLPIISHWDSTALDLRVTKCRSLTCADSVSTSIDTANSVGRYSSMAVGTDGLAIISHRNSTTNVLRVTHCDDIDCTTATSRDVDTAGAVGMYTSIAIGSDGLPVISHRDSITELLRVTHCGDITCSTATSVTVAAAGILDWNTAIAIGTDGFPVIAHRDGGSGDLRVTHCNNVTCSAAVSTVVDQTNDAGFDADIAIGSDGLPVVSHWDNTVFDLRVTRCSNVTCTAATSVAASTAGDVGQYTSIGIGTDGFPVVSHWAGGTVTDLKVTQCGNLTCSSATSTTVDTAGNVGQFSSLVIGPDGLPIISHYDATNTRLRVTKCNSRSCR